MSIGTNLLALKSREELLRRNGIFETFFRTEAPRLAEACHEMSRRFLAGGRLLAFGNGPAATDAQHVSVEFVLPVILRPEDMVMGFAFPERDEAVERALLVAKELGARTFALAGEVGDYPFALPDEDPFVCQEVFEVLYYMLWETVHVYFEHRE